MKKIIAFFLIAFCTSNVFGQQEPIFENEVLTTSTGFKIKEGDKLKVGVGSADDGAFNFIRVNSSSLMYTYSPNGLNTRGAAANNALPASYSGLYVEVAKIEKRGSKKRGFVFYPIVKVGGMARYEVDIENAIAKEEIIIPEEFRPKTKKSTSQGDVKPELSIADELTKLKKLVTDGVLTEEEYNTQKKKLLGN